MRKAGPSDRTLPLRGPWWLPLLLPVFFVAPALGAAPAEVTGVEFGDPALLEWDSVPLADTYNVYRAPISSLAAGYGGRCHLHAIQATSANTSAVPDPGEGFIYLVTAESNLDGEGTAGSSTGGIPREPEGRCSPVMQSHVLNRLGFGQDEWSAARIATLGLQGYVDEQLDPSSIDESTNMELQTRLVANDPPEDINELIARQVIQAVYVRRQLEQQAAAFWSNHFSTDWAKIANLYIGAFPDCATALPQCDPDYPARAYLEASLAQHLEMEEFRDLAFNGRFRQILDVSARSPAMIIYLDTIGNVTPIANENYARELMELHTMGVDGGFTEADVQELARVFTGWTLCKKEDSQVGDPLAPCHPYWEPTPPGRIVATFVDSLHDCGSKTLFSGAPEEVIIPSTCGTPVNGVNDLTIALDAIASHPSTKRFISTKILQRFVTDSPSGGMIDALVAAWNDAGNPQGIGDLREVLRAAFSLAEFLDPDRTNAKIKTPMEHIASAFRAIRGTTDGRGYAVSFLVDAQHIPHYNPVPTGYPESGGPWIDTTNTLTRQNYGLLLAALEPGDFGSDPITLLQNNGISTANGNETAIIDFLDRHLFAGRLSESDRQAALFYLTTDNLGNPAPFDDYKIRKTVGVMLGFAQFQEQ